MVTSFVCAVVEIVLTLVFLAAGWNFAAALTGFAAVVILSDVLWRVIEGE